MNEAIDAYLEMHHWQIEEIQRGITEAETADFASDEEVKATFAKLTNTN
ncbi:CopG family ribbon-helix-helix protein [Calothrix sp. NIES-2098]